MPTNFGTVATIVSLFPLEVVEKKPLIPSVYQLDASRSDSEPEILTVREGIFHVYLDEYRGMMTIKTPAITVAESVVRDFMDSQYMAEEIARPALFCLPGEWTLNELLANNEQQARMEAEVRKQYEWFKRLILVADDEWSKFHQHRMITEVQKIAAMRLRLNREWAVEYTPENNIDCPACGVLINRKVAVCKDCGCIINAELYNSLQFTGEVRHKAV